MSTMIRWLFSRIAVVYVIILVFCLVCVDFKTLNMRIKTRHLNDSIPDFSDMIIFSQDPTTRKNINWKPYKHYFELILRYMPNDLITRQLLGYVDYYSGEEQKAIELFKSSSEMKGYHLFLSNYNLGVIYYKRQKWQDSVEYLVKAVESNPQLATTLIKGSIVYRQIFISPFFKSSLSEEMNEAQTNAYILLLSSLFHLGKYDKLVYLSDLAIKNPNLSHKDAFYYYAGLGFLETGQWQQAFMLFQKSLDIEKQNPDVYYYIAGIYQKGGQQQQAQVFLQASYALHQKNDGRFPYENHVDLRFF